MIFIEYSCTFKSKHFIPCLYSHKSKINDILIETCDIFLGVNVRPPYKISN